MHEIYITCTLYVSLPARIRECFCACIIQEQYESIMEEYKDKKMYVNAHLNVARRQEKQKEEQQKEKQVEGPEASDAAEEA